VIRASVALFVQANRNMPLEQEMLQLANALLVEMKYRRGEGGVGVAGANTSAKVLERPRAARGDHRDVDGI
jgi:hypothetical protein